MGQPLDNPFFDENLSPGGPDPADYMPDKLFSEQNPLMAGPDPRDYLPNFQTPAESTSPQPMSMDDKMEIKKNMMLAIGEDLKSSAINPLAMGKRHQYDADWEHHNYERYYNHPDFAELGFSPFRDNESLYNANSSFIDEMRRAGSQWGSQFSLGFTDAMGFGSQSDREAARTMEKSMAIGSSSKGGVGGFMTNLYLNSGYTFGIIAELALEELALAGVTALSGFSASEVTVPMMGVRATRAGNKIWKGWKGAGKLMSRLDNLKDINKIRSGLKNFGVGTAKFLNPAAESMHFLKNYKKMDNLSGLARTTHGAASLYRDVRNIRLAWGEAGLEAGMVENDIRRTLTEEAFREYGTVTDAEADKISATANAAAARTAWNNTAAIFYSNKIVFDNMFKSFRPFRMVGDDLITRNAAGKIMFNKAAKDNAFSVVEKGYKGFLKSAKNPRSWGRVGSNYFKANFAEGLQETTQEVIAGAATDYYMARHRGNADEGGWYAAVGDNLVKQVSPEGFEIFMSGFLMGGLVQPVMKVPGYVKNHYKKFSDPAGYEKLQQEKAEYLNKTVNDLNDMYDDPLKYFAPDVENMLVQKEYSEGMREAGQAGDAKTFNDIKDASTYDHIYTALRTGKFDTFVQRLDEMKSLNEEEVQQTYNMDKASFDAKIDQYVERAKSIESRFDLVERKYSNPFNPSNQKYGTPAYQKEMYNFKGYQDAQKQLVFMQDSFDNTLRRMQSMMEGAAKDAKLKNTPTSDINVLFTMNDLTQEIGQLKAEISSMADTTTAEGKKLRNAKQVKMDLLQDFTDAMQGFMESTATDQGATTGIKSLNDIDGGVDSPAVKKVHKAFEKYMKHLAKTNGDYAFNDALQESFIKLLDYYVLNDESHKLNDAVNEMINPGAFARHAARLSEVIGQIHKDRKANIERALEEWLKVKEQNDLMQLLHDEGIFFDPSEFKALEQEGKLPTTFYSVVDKDEIQIGSDEWNKAVSIIDNFAKDIMDIPIPERSSTCGGYCSFSRYKINNDKRTYKDYAEQYGFDPAARETKVPLKQVLQGVIDSKYATKREKTLAERYLDIATDEEFVVFSKTEANPGVYSGVRQTVIDARYSSTNYEGGTVPFEHVIMHEETHRRTVEGLETDPEFNDKITELRELAIEFQKQEAERINAETQERLRTETGRVEVERTKPMYGLKNNAEFVAEAMSNDSFQIFLGKIDYEGAGKSGWQEFVDSVINLLKKVFGKRVSGTVLNAAFEVITTKIDSQYGAQEVGRVDQAKLAEIEASRKAELKRKVTDRHDVFTRQQEFEDALEDNQELQKKIGDKLIVGELLEYDRVDDHTSSEFTGEPYRIVIGIIQPGIITDGVLTQRAKVDVGEFDSKEDADQWLKDKKAALEETRKKATDKINAKYNAQIAKLRAEAVTTTTPAQVKVTNKTPLAELRSSHPELMADLLQAYKDRNALNERNDEDPIDAYWSEKSDEQLLESPQFKRFVSQAVFSSVKKAFKAYNERTGRTLEPETKAKEPKRQRPTISREGEAGRTASIPVIWTQQMKRDFAALGYTPEEQRKLTPSQGWDIINEGLTKEEREEREIEAQAEPQEDLTLQREIRRAEITDTISAAKNLKELEEAEEMVLAMLSSPADRTAAGFTATDVVNMINSKKEDLAFSINFEDVIIGEVMILNDGRNTKVKVESKDNNVLQTYAVDDITRRFNIKADQVQDKVKYRYSPALEEVGIAPEEELTEAEVAFSNESQQNSQDVLDRDSITRMINNAREGGETGWRDNINEC